MVLLLVGGAIVNDAVAWGIACASMRIWKSNSISLEVPKRADAWPVAVPPNLPRASVLTRGTHLGWTLTRFLGHADTGLIYPELFQVDCHHFGWPVRSLRAEKWEHVGPLGGTEAHPTVTTWHNGCPSPIGLKFVPLQPLWPGFAINTIFYAAILWLLFVTPGAVRRTIRRRRGLCPACAYPIGVSPICTECGVRVHISINNE